MDANYHTHTSRCGHANGTDEQYVRAAIEAGFKLLGFSDHVPYEGIHAPKDRMDYDQIDEYLASINHLKVKYQDKIKILSGFEVEFYPEYIDYYKHLLTRCDYLVLGQHNVTFLKDDLDCYASDEDVEKFAEALVQAMDSGLFSYIAHPDYFMMGRRHWNETCIAAAHKIAQKAAELKYPLELNLNGLRHGHKPYKAGLAYVYPYRPFWEIVAQYDTICVYGYDAHHPTTLLEDDRIVTINKIIQGIPLNIVENYRL